MDTRAIHLGTPKAEHSGRLTVMHSIPAPWHIKDFLMVAMVATNMYSVPDVPFLPISPAIIIPFILFVACYREWNKWGGHLLRISAFRLFLILYGLMIVGEFGQKGISYASIAEAGRLVASALSVIALALYTMSSQERMQRTINVVGMMIVISVAWFIMEITAVNPFVSFRTHLYADLYASQTSLNIENIRSGLTPFTHQMGYQLVAIAPLLFVQWNGKRQFSHKIAYLAGSTGVFLSLYFTGQRSALLGIVVSLTFIVAYNRIKLRAYQLLLILFLGSISSFLVISIGSWKNDTLNQGTLEEKLQSEMANKSIIFRLELQLKALELSFQYPLGLDIAGVDWETVGYWPVKQQSDNNAFNKPISVHNGYLAPTLKYGIVVFVCAVFMLLRIFELSFWLMRSRWASQPHIARMCTVVGSTIIGLYFVQAMLHNGSLLNREPMSLFFLALALGLKLFCDSTRESLQARTSGFLK